MPFERRPWSTPKSDLSAEEYCSVCLIDMNPPGKKKVKGLCKLPVKRAPGAPYNINGMRAAAAALLGARGGVQAPTSFKRKAARKLIRLFREAGIPYPERLKRVAGL